MPEVQSSITTPRRQVDAGKHQFYAKKHEIRAGFEDFIRVNFEETGLLSTSEVQDMRQHMESVLRTDEWDEVIGSYLGSFAEKNKAANLQLYRDQVEAPLNNALTDGIISAESHAEWIAWMRDPNRESKTKKTSIKTTLPTYLAERRRLASKRDTVLHDPRFAALSESKDPSMKALCAKVSDQDFFLHGLSFEERKSVITDILASLPIIDEEKKLYAEFMKELDSAVGKYISHDSKKRWIARFNDASVSTTAREYFIKWQFPAYVQSWKKIHGTYDELKKNKEISSLKKEDCKDIDIFKSPEKFLTLHYEKKVNLVKEVQNALKAKAEGKEAHMKEIKSIIDTAAQARYVSSDNTAYLVEHMLERNRTVQEVKNFAKEWAKMRFRFDKVEAKMTDGRVPQGLSRLSESAFLKLTFAQKKSYVEEVENRLNIEKSDTSNEAFKDIKGKVRHALDSENWEEAKQFIQKAWPMAESEEDRQELESMQRYLESFGKSSEGANEDKSMQTALEAKKEIDSCLTQLPAPIRAFYEKALKKNAGCVRTIGVMLYNVQWGLDRGYQPRDLSTVKDVARNETEVRMRPGIGHQDGLENNLVDGFGKPAIREKGYGPQNICASASEADRVVETANVNQNNYNFWYWSNLIVDGVSVGEYENVANNLRKKLTRAAYTMENSGHSYASMA